MIIFLKVLGMAFKQRVRVWAVILESRAELMQKGMKELVQVGNAQVITFMDDGKLVIERI